MAVLTKTEPVIFYLALIAVIVLLATILRPSSTSSRRRAFTIVTFGMLAAVAGTRTCDVGRDTRQYCEYYSIMGSLGWADSGELRYEPGFFLLNKLLHSISTSPQLLIATTSIVTICGIAYFFYKSGVDIAAGACMFILLQGYAGAMTAMRQAMATAIVLALVPRLAKRKPLGFVLAVAVASQFHASAWILLVLVPLAWAQFRKRAVLFILLVSVSLWAASEPILAFVSQATGLYSEYYESYAGTSGKTGVVLQAAVFLILLLVASHARGSGGRAERESGESSFLVLAGWMSVPAVAMAYGSNVYLRLTFYFIPLLAAVAAGRIDEIPHWRDRDVSRLLLGLTALVYFIVLSYLRPEWFQVIPYRSALL